MADGIYDLEGTKGKIAMLRQIFDAKLEVAVLKDLLEKHGIIDSFEFDAAKNYLATTGEFKQMKDQLDQISAQVNHFQQNQGDYLKFLFNQKLNGQG